MKTSSKLFNPFLLFLSAALYASTVHSARVDYLLNEQTNVVTGNGYEWLRWDQTRMMSISQAVDTYSPEDWRVASNSEMAFLFNDYFGFNQRGYYAFDPDENTSQEVFDPNSSRRYRTFIEQFGLMSAHADILEFPEMHVVLRAEALFGTDPDEDGLYNLASVNYDYWLDPVTLEYIDWQDAHASLGADEYSRDFYSEDYGVALVRDVNSIPLPGALPLFASAMIVFGWFHRRKKLV